jgi:hypothetical protein
MTRGPITYEELPKVSFYSIKGLRRLDRLFNGVFARSEARVPAYH